LGRSASEKEVLLSETQREVEDAPLDDLRRSHHGKVAVRLEAGQKDDAAKLVAKNDRLEDEAGKERHRVKQDLLAETEIQ
jgi:hypothetical protein